MMTNIATSSPLRVEPNERAGPYLMVSMDQLPDVQRLLTERGVFYWVDRYPVVLGGRPAVTFINFGHQGKVDDLQALLDGRS